MQAQHPALTAPLLANSAQPHSTTDLLGIRIQADRLCMLVSLACLLFAGVEGLAYGNVAEALGWGMPLFAASFVITRFFAGQTLTMYLNAALLVAMGALHVHVARGLLEFHFSFFMLLPVMLAYRDTRPLVAMGLMILAHHVVFDMLQQAGFECYIFRGPFSGLPAVALHGFYVVVEVLLLSMIAKTLREHALAAQESASLISHLNKENRVNLRVRAQANSSGQVSALGKVFNDYADNMSLVVAAFKMLHTDIQELSEIAKHLGADNTTQLEDSAQASKNLRTFIQNLGNQTSMGQSTAELSRKVTEDCFDLINELNQSLEQLQKISKNAFDSKQQIQNLLKDLHREPGTAASPQLVATLSTLDNLNERTQDFMGKMDLLKSGLSAIENQVVSIDRSTHQWVENGHGNQRQGWEVLGAMEGMQNRAESALRTLGSTVQTIVRADELTREMEKRLSRFDL